MICIANECQSGTLACTRSECGYARLDKAMQHPLGGGTYYHGEQAITLEGKEPLNFRPYLIGAAVGLVCGLGVVAAVFH